MLSNETAVGAHPVETVAMMRRTVDEALKHTSHGLVPRFTV
jgi:pyruvate kinase